MNFFSFIFSIQPFRKFKTLKLFSFLTSSSLSSVVYTLFLIMTKSLLQFFFTPPMYFKISVVFILTSMSSYSSSSSSSSLSSSTSSTSSSLIAHQIFHHHFYHIHFCFAFNYSHELKFFTRMQPGSASH